MGYGLWVMGRCTNGCTMLLQSPYYPPTMVRLNSAQRNECINWHAAWLIAQSVATEKKKKQKKKKNQKKENKKEKERVRYSRTSYSARAHTRERADSHFFYI